MSINLTKISYFVGDISEPELIQLLESFRTTLITRQQELLNACREGDYRRIAQLSHNLKSNALYFGADKLHEVCQSGEMLTQSRKPAESELASWLDGFEAICQQVLQCIEQVLKEKRHDKKARER